MIEARRLKNVVIFIQTNLMNYTTCFTNVLIIRHLKREIVKV